MSTIADKLKLGKHYSMERFGIMAFLSIGLVLGLVIWGGIVTARRNRLQDLYQVVYQGNFSTSATGASGYVAGVWEDSERDDAAILLKFSSMGSISNRAEDYTAEVHGMKNVNNLGKLKTPISDGTFTIYGNTGYAVVTFHSDKPFERELAQVMIGDNNLKIPPSRRTGKESLGKLYDIFYFVLNLGGDGVGLTNSFGEDGTFDSARFFQEAIVSGEERSIRGKLNDDLIDMSDALDAITNAERRAEGDGIDVASGRPVWVDGDEVYDEDGHPSFRTSTIAQGGFDFDWYNGSISDGYLADLAYAAGFDDAVEYLDTQRSVAQAWEYEPKDWMLASGEVINARDDDAGSAALQDYVNDVATLEAAYSKYADLKSKYQIDDLTSLLELEVVAADRSSVFTENKDAFLSYVE